MSCAVFEKEVEAKLGGGALVVVEAGAEGLEEALGNEEDGLMVYNRGLELVFDLVVILGTVELEEAVRFPEGEVVELSEIGAETLGEALAGQLCEIIESLEAPELEDCGVR